MEQVTYHVHNGSDAPQLDGDSLRGCPLPPLTVANVNVPTGTYTSLEQNVISNLQTRVNELEARLQQLAILQ